MPFLAAPSSTPARVLASILYILHIRETKGEKLKLSSLYFPAPEEKSDLQFKLPKTETANCLFLMKYTRLYPGNI